MDPKCYLVVLLVVISGTDNSWKTEASYSVKRRTTTESIKQQLEEIRERELESLKALETPDEPYLHSPYKTTKATVRSPYRYRQRTRAPYRWPRLTTVHYNRFHFRTTLKPPYIPNYSFDNYNFSNLDTNWDKYRHPSNEKTSYNAPSSSSTSSRGSIGGIIGAVVSVVFTILWVLSIVLRKMKCRRNTQPGLVIATPGPPTDGMHQPLTTNESIVNNGGYQNPNSFQGQGNALGTIQYETEQTRLTSPVAMETQVPPITGPTDPRLRRSRARHLARLIEVRRQRLQAQNELQSILESQNDLVPEVDQNDPVAMEAITDLTEMSRGLQHPLLRIEVRRETIVDDLIRIYSDMSQSDLNKMVVCKLTGEEGVDGGGVTRDLYTTFWQTVKEQYFKGNIAFVPQINLGDYDFRVFTVLGRIFSHTTLLLRAIPLQICRTTLSLIIYGEMEMADCSLDTILDDFFLFIDMEDRSLIRMALQSFEALTEIDTIKLQYIFEKFGLEKQPDPETLKNDLSYIAYNELCVKPRAVCQKMGQGIPTAHRELFWGHMTLRHLEALYCVFRPTPGKVIEKLRCLRWPLHSRTSANGVFENLKRFIGTMSEDTLLRFLQFVTGERKVPIGPILVQFTDAEGVARVPKAHTCVNMIELPMSYTNYEEFKHEFTNVLNSDEAMEMNME